VVDVASGERRQVTTDYVDYCFPEWSPDGKRLAAQVPNRNGMCSQLALIAVETGETQLIGPERGVVAVWSWSPSGDRIIFAGDTRNSWQTDFFVYDVASASVRRLTDDLACLPISGMPGRMPPAQPVWLDRQRVLFHAMRAGASGLYVIDATTGRGEEIHASQALKTGLSVDAERRYAVQGHASLNAVGEITVFDYAAGTERQITQNNARVLADAPPAAWERFDVQRGELTIEAWLLKPPDFDPARRYPLILDVHGGPNGFYGYGFNNAQQCLATNGFLVAFANPRGSSSYGRHFTQQVIQDWGGEDYLDLLAVVDAVLERPYVDRERTAIYGYSYGGYMTSWTIGQTNRFQAAVCGAPCFDLESMYGTSDISHTFGELQWGGPPHQARAWYEAHSPSTNAHRARTPTLIVHGEADERCPIGQGEQMFIALKQAGCEVELARYPGGSHSFPSTGPAEHRFDYLTRVLGWFTSHLGEKK
jgi:dipeptidyl aminopeptidase/acylaminoacyl peptidase